VYLTQNCNLSVLIGFNFSKLRFVDSQENTLFKNIKFDPPPYHLKKNKVTLASSKQMMLEN
jgi:acyl dehydratase